MTQASLPNLPPSWDRWLELSREGVTPQTLGLPATTSKSVLQRFASRFRVAKSFRGLTLDGYTDRTLQAYAGLLRLFLAWSAFEQFMHVLGCQQAGVEPYLADYAPTELVGQVRRIDPPMAFYKFVEPRLDRQAARAQLHAFFEYRPFNVTYLASCPRHVFAHGALPALPKGVKPALVPQICDTVADFILRVMEGEFMKVVNRPIPTEARP